MSNVGIRKVVAFHVTCNLSNISLKTHNNCLILSKHVFPSRVLRGKLEKQVGAVWKIIIF